MPTTDQEIITITKWIAWAVAILILIRMTIKRFNRVKVLYNEVDSLDADINTALGHRRDLLLRARIIAKDYQDHELRMKALRPDANIVISGQSQPNMAPALPIVATSSAGTKADESQNKVQHDINEVEGYLRARIEKQHLAVKEYRNYRDSFPNFLFAKVIGAREVQFFKYKDEESLYRIEDINAADRDLHRSILGAAVSSQGGMMLAEAKKEDV
ncbi:MAG: hypothetical protein IPP19_08010 [Verrucomicrobia bacterium]|nr:hypothetical protein [Verrucomicrobiota bacterium]